MYIFERLNSFIETEKYTMDYQLDNLDKQIIDLLSENAKLSNKEIASKIGLTVTPTFERIKRLERIGMIKGYTVVLNKKMIGKGLKVQCLVSLKEHHLDLLKSFESKIVHFDEVSECYHIAGDYDYILVIEVGDMDEYQFFLKEKLASIPSISNVQSSFVMSTIK